MRRFDDEQVVCPFDEKHKMPKARLQWHFVKCKAKLEREQQGLPTYHCRHHYMHIFFDAEPLAIHEATCEFAVKREPVNENQSTWSSSPVTKNKGWGHEYEDRIVKEPTSFSSVLMAFAFMMLAFTLTVYLFAPLESVNLWTQYFNEGRDYFLSDSRFAPTTA